MKLKPLPKADGVARVSWSIRASTLESLEAYLEYYKNVYGQSVDKSPLVDAMLRDYMASDASFKAHLKKKDAGKAPAGPSA